MPRAPLFPWHPARGAATRDRLHGRLGHLPKNSTLSRRRLLAVDGCKLFGRRRVGEPLVGPLAEEAWEAQREAALGVHLVSGGSRGVEREGGLGWWW